MPSSMRKIGDTPEARGIYVHREGSMPSRVHGPHTRRRLARPGRRASGRSGRGVRSGPTGWLTRSASWCLRCDIPPGASFLFGAVFGDPASIRFGERAPESSDFKIPAVGRRSGLLSPGVVQVTTVDRVEAEFVDQAKHWGLRLDSIAGNRESYAARRSRRNALFEKALGVDVVECLDYRSPELLRDPLAVEHASLNRIDAAIAKLRIVVAGIDHDDAVRHVRKQPPRKIGDVLLWDRDDDDFSCVGGVDHRNGRRTDLCCQRGQAVRSSGVRNRDLMAELGEMARECPSDGSSADDSDSHVDSSFHFPPARNSLKT